MLTGLPEFFLMAFVSLFAVVNPFSSVPAFLAITDGDSREDRIRMARTGCLTACVLLAVFALSGQWLVQFLGVSIPAFQVAGGVILFTIGFDMLRAPEMKTRLNEQERELALRKDDIAISPLAVPLLCGPGSISTAIILQTQTESWAGNAVLLAAVPFVYLASYGVFRAAIGGARWVNPIVLRIMRRLMGLLFAVIAAQFVINGVVAVVPMIVEALAEAG